MTKIALFDLDDTLSKSKQTVEKDMATIYTELLDVMPAGIVTGAKFEQIKKQFIDELPPTANLQNLYCFTQNAASCFAYNAGAFSPLYSFAFTDDEAKTIIDALNKVITETGIVDNEPSHGERIENRGSQITFSALGQAAPGDLKKVWDPDQAKRIMLRNKLLEIIPQFDIGIGGGTSLDITQKGINKTYAMKWITENLSIPVAEMVYVGDALFPGGNDAVVIPTGIPTIQTSGPTETLDIIRKIIVGA